MEQIEHMSQNKRTQKDSNFGELGEKPNRTCSYGEYKI